MCLPLSYSFNLASCYVLISLTYDPFRTVEFRMLLDENIIRDRYAAYARTTHPSLSL